MEVITTHITADFDALASMITARKLYPDAVLAFPGSQEKSIRDFMLQSTAYFLDIQKASSIRLESITRLILVDIRQQRRIGKFASILSRPGLDIHIYDHHPPSPEDIHGSVEIIRPYGSTTAILCELLQERRIEVLPDEATVMMLGIYEDTGNLTFSSTTAHDFHAAAFLLEQGANLNVVSDMVIKELSAEQVALLNQLIESSVTLTVRGVDILVAKAVSDSYVGDFAVLVHKLKNMGGVNALVALAEMGDCMYLVARSRIREVNAGEIAAAFGGGGHETAASATIRGMTMYQVEQKLPRVLGSAIRPVSVARDFMATPVKTIEVGSSLDRASSSLTRYNINVMPVMEGDRIVGLISRQIIERARHHGLEGIPVREYMTSEFATVSENTPIDEIKKHIIDGNQRFLPVLNRRKLTGAITRTDLMRVLHVGESGDARESAHRAGEAQTKKIKNLLQEQLPEAIRRLLQDLGGLADELGYNAYAVGGFVRDILLRNENLDIDVVVEGDAIGFSRLFAQRHGCTIKVYSRFGTAAMAFDSGTKIDVASARLEYYERPAALPKVEWSSIKLDLYRRDFTINTLAIRLNPKNFGEMIDFFGARRDIKEKTIRVLHNLSFVEDPSRIFRAVRFEQRLGFRISKLTTALIHNAVKHDFPSSMSGKRVFSEIALLFQESQVLPIVGRLNDFGLLKYVHPAIRYDAALKSLLRNTADVLSWYDLLYLDNVCKKWFVFFLGLIDRVQAEDLEALLRSFDVKKQYAEPIHIAKTTGHAILYELAHKKTFTNSEIYRILHGVPTEVSLHLMAKTTRSATRKAFSLYYTKIRNVKAHLTGKDLTSLGVPPGKIYRELLDRLMDEILDGRVEGRDEELHFIRTAIDAARGTRGHS